MVLVIMMVTMSRDDSHGDGKEGDDDDGNDGNDDRTDGGTTTMRLMCVWRQRGQ